MAFHFIVTCVSQKTTKKVHSILDQEIEPGPIAQVFHQWQTILSQSTLKPKRAKNLYKGPLWSAFMDGWGIINGRLKDAQLWILSAGHGLVSAEDPITPYDITFQEPRDQIPSVLSKVNDLSGVECRRNALQSWWKFLIDAKRKEPVSIESLLTHGKTDDHFLFVLSKDYLDATFDDLKRGIKGAKAHENIAIISNNINDPLARRLKPNWLYANSSFVSLPSTNSTLVNANITKKLLWQMFQVEDGTSWWAHDNFNKYLKELSSGLNRREIPRREPTTDLQVETYIKEVLAREAIPFSTLHREYRNSGRACEYTRFRSIYSKVTIELKKATLAKRPVMHVQYERRKTRMLFFLPDWDDRVDPLYDFEKDEPTQNRDPYEHDAYHYELYGKLNCDGILVSKSVLEGNAQKKEKARQKGIHRYLRLPQNVPVFGDCGAFNYITEETPPYETDEILEYYGNLGFNYGVSVDHLIVPGILKKNRFFKKQKDDWIKIDQNEFLRLKKMPDFRIAKHRNNRQQFNLFPSENVIVEETYLDEKERERRYELTIENAFNFIEGHRKGDYEFKPVGAVQGWDPESYMDAVKDYQNMGYSYIALGGLVRSTTNYILQILESISKIRKPKTKMHLFGVARLDAIESFMKLGVSSVDSAGVLRQAWLSSSSNYYSPDMNHYTAIRVPPAKDDHSRDEEKGMGDKEKSDIRELENKCLSSIRKFNSNKTSLDRVLDIIAKYDECMGGNGNLHEKYLRTLTDKPWKKCPCKLCKETGVDIIVFRRNNRNRRRGFHNTWVFFNKFRELTNIK